MEKYAINRTGRALSVYQSNDFSVQNGTIYNNECFAVTETRDIQGSDGNVHEGIYFKGTDGMKSGWLVNTGSGEAVSFLDFSFGNVTVNGTTYKSLKTRKATARYDASGNYKGTTVSGGRILTNDTTPGQSMPNCMRAMYYETGEGTNVFLPISGTSGAYGFVDTAISSGSDAARIGIYGNW